MIKTEKREYKKNFSRTGNLKARQTSLLFIFNVAPRPLKKNKQTNFFSVGVDVIHAFVN